MYIYIYVSKLVHTINISNLFCCTPFSVQLEAKLVRGFSSLAPRWVSSLLMDQFWRRPGEGRLRILLLRCHETADMK